MAKRNYYWTEEKIQRYRKEGRGLGEGKDYLPWLTIQDCPSDNRATRCKGWKTGRNHELMNDPQTRFLFAGDWADDVIDIREHFPLDREITSEIAQKKGYKFLTQSGTPAVITTDFLITCYRDNQKIYIPHAIIQKRKIEQPKIISKLEIEQEYWKLKNSKLVVVTEDELLKPFVSNLEWVHEHYYLEDLSDLKKDELEELIIVLLERIERSEQNLQRITNNLDKELNVIEGTFLYLVRHLIARKIIKLDMTQQRIYPSKILARDVIVNPYQSYKKEQLM